MSALREIGYEGYLTMEIGFTAETLSRTSSRAKPMNI
jgi:hypothetical protein